MAEYFEKNGIKIRLNTPEEEVAINKAALSDPDNLPTTEEEAKSARPFRDLYPEIVEVCKRSRGRPRGSNKTRITINLDKDIIAALKAEQPKGWQTRLNNLLRETLSL